MARPELPYATLLFDGVCNLCNGWVDFAIRRDPAGRVRFAALQSDAGRAVLARHGIPEDYLESLLLVDEAGKVHSGSSGVLRTLARLRWPWPILSALLVVPRPVRDLVYRLIASRRYDWFGKRDTCRLPSAEERERFL